MVHKHAHEVQSATAAASLCGLVARSQLTGLLPSQQPPEAARVVTAWRWSQGRLCRNHPLQTKWKPAHDKGFCLAPGSPTTPYLVAPLLLLLLVCPRTIVPTTPCYIATHLRCHVGFAQHILRMGQKEMAACLCVRVCRAAAVQHLPQVQGRSEAEVKCIWKQSCWRFLSFMTVLRMSSSTRPGPKYVFTTSCTSRHTLSLETMP